MAQFQVDSEQIQSSSAAVNASIQAIRQSVQGMYANLNNLQSVWRGGAATQFNAVAEQWRARPTADGAVARIDSACADAGIRTVCGNRNAGIASVCAVAAGTSDAIKAIAGANKKWSPRPLWETDSTYSFLLMPSGFAKPLDQ